MNGKIEGHKVLKQKGSGQITSGVLCEQTTRGNFRCTFETTMFHLSLKVWGIWCAVIPYMICILCCIQWFTFLVAYLELMCPIFIIFTSFLTRDDWREVNDPMYVSIKQHRGLAGCFENMQCINGLGIQLRCHLTVIQAILQILCLSPNKYVLPHSYSSHSLLAVVVCTFNGAPLIVYLI